MNTTAKKFIPKAERLRRAIFVEDIMDKPSDYESPKQSKYFLQRISKIRTRLLNFRRTMEVYHINNCSKH